MANISLDMTSSFIYLFIINMFVFRGVQRGRGTGRPHELTLLGLNDLYVLPVRTTKQLGQLATPYELGASGGGGPTMSISGKAAGGTGKAVEKFREVQER